MNEQDIKTEIELLKKDIDLIKPLQSLKLDEDL